MENSISDTKNMQYRSKGLQLVNSRWKNFTPIQKKVEEQPNSELSERRSQSFDISNNSVYVSFINPKSKENNLKTHLINDYSVNDGKPSNEIYIDNFNIWIKKHINNVIESYCFYDLNNIIKI